MSSLGISLARLAMVLVALAALGISSPVRRPLVLISIDGLRPRDVFDADRYGLRIPNLRRLLREGTHATAVTAITPAVTYPSHTTLVTGVGPAHHGISHNLPFDPLGRNAGGWFWYTEDIHAETLWDAAARQGLTTGAVDWPVGVGAAITFNIAQYWRAAGPDVTELERIDRLVGGLRDAAGRTTDGRAVIAIVSDHGFTLTTRELDLNGALQAGGLLQLDSSGGVRGWRAAARGGKAGGDQLT